MIQNIYKVSQIMVFLPFIAVPASSLTVSSIGNNRATQAIVIEKKAETLHEIRAKKIDTYFKERDMPLTGKGMQFVLVAEKYGLDWNLLPAIAVRESSGGKNDCGFNPFGWGSCKLHNFKSYDEAIYTLAQHLGGAKERTSRYYAGKTSYEKLYYYNGTVLPSYPDEVFAIMEKINTTKTQ